jgi:acyl-CoA synthetase (AMP-forming)/AMP-acid ligase II
MTAERTDTALTVYDAVCQSVNRHASRPFLHIPATCCQHYHDGPINIDYAELDRRVQVAAERYSSAGYGQGHRVALLLENRPDFFVHWFALNSLAVSVVPINGEMAGDEIAYLLSHSESCLGVCVASKQINFQAAADSAGLTLPIITIDQAIPEASTEAVEATIDEQSECALLYTSGSTGKPKGCVLNNEYFLYCGRWYQELGGLCQIETGIERLLTPLPLVHMNAMACSSMVMIMTGGCIVQLDRFHPSNWWQTVRDSKASIVHYLGVMPAMLLNKEPLADEDFSSQIKFGFGAGVNPKHHAPFEQRFGFPLVEAWAMTESGCGGAIIANREPRHVGTCCFGKAPAGIEYRLVDELGNEVAAGEQGELLVRASGENPWRGFFSAYLKNAEATAEATADNWLHTGDVVRVGEDGSMFFVDRRKNVIRRSGENISALEVEAVMTESSIVDSVVVVPVPDEVRGDEVFAVVILRPGLDTNEQLALELFQHCQNTLVYYKTPGYIHFVTQLPLTASGKPQRGELKTLARDWLQQGHCFDLRDRKRRVVRASA